MNLVPLLQQEYIMGRPTTDFFRHGYEVHVYIYKSRGELSLLVQPAIKSVFLTYFDPKKYTQKQKITVNQIFNSDATKFRETLILGYFQKFSEIFSSIQASPKLAKV